METTDIVQQIQQFELYIPVFQVSMQLRTAYHQWFKRFSYECQLPIAHLVFKQRSECPSASATHDRSLL